jgi:hypothetical protein
MVKFAQIFPPRTVFPQKPAQLAIFFIAGMAGAKMLPAGFPARFGAPVGVAVACINPKFLPNIHTHG